MSTNLAREHSPYREYAEIKIAQKEREDQEILSFFDTLFASKGMGKFGRVHYAQHIMKVISEMDNNHKVKIANTKRAVISTLLFVANIYLLFWIAQFDHLGWALSATWLIALLVEIAIFLYIFNLWIKM